MVFNNSTSFESEWIDTIRVLRQRNTGYKQLSWFLDLGQNRFRDESLQKEKPRVILLDHCFPEEIVRSMTSDYLYLLSGSFSAAGDGEPMTPRDTDSAIRAALGMLTNPEWKLADKAIVLLPLVNDSMRKLYDMLSDQMKIIPYEIPNDRSCALQRGRWQEEVLRVTFELEKHLRRRLSGRALKKQCAISEDAKQAWITLCENCIGAHPALSGSARLWLANSYHWCKDTAEWTEHMYRLAEEVQEHSTGNSPETPHSHVLLLGSPIYAPNYKIPLLIEEMGMEMYSMIHPDIAHILSARRCTGGRIDMIRKLADQYLDADMSPAFVCNKALEDALHAVLEKAPVEGVVMHILKGQIEYDFELNRLEPMIDGHQVPVFRLETEYNYQDVEQLRIRMEAFAEMLQHRKGIAQEAWNVKEAV